MSQENVEIVRRLIQTNRSGPPDETVEAAFALAGDEVEFFSRLSSVEGATYRGSDGIRAYYRDMYDTMREWRNEVNEVRRAGLDAVYADLTFRGTARSGVAVELRSGVIFSLSEGRVTRVDAYPSRQEALEAVGLSE